MKLEFNFDYLKQLLQKKACQEKVSRHWVDFIKNITLTMLTNEHFMNSHPFVYLVVLLLFT